MKSILITPLIILFTFYSCTNFKNTKDEDSDKSILLNKNLIDSCKPFDSTINDLERLKSCYGIKLDENNSSVFTKEVKLIEIISKSREYLPKFRIKSKQCKVTHYYNCNYFDFIAERPVNDTVIDYCCFFRVYFNMNKIEYIQSFSNRPILYNMKFYPFNFKQFTLIFVSLIYDFKSKNNSSGYFESPCNSAFVLIDKENKFAISFTQDCEDVATIHPDEWNFISVLDDILYPKIALEFHYKKDENNVTTSKFDGCFRYEYLKNSRIATERTKLPYNFNGINLSDSTSYIDLLNLIKNADSLYAKKIPIVLRKSSILGRRTEKNATFPRWIHL